MRKSFSCIVLLVLLMCCTIQNRTEARAITEKAVRRYKKPVVPVSYPPGPLKLEQNNLLTKNMESLLWDVSRARLRMLGRIKRFRRWVPFRYRPETRSTSRQFSLFENLEQRKQDDDGGTMNEIDSILAPATVTNSSRNLPIGVFSEEPNLDDFLQEVPASSTNESTKLPLIDEESYVVVAPSSSTGLKGASTEEPPGLIKIPLYGTAQASYASDFLAPKTDLLDGVSEEKTDTVELVSELDNGTITTSSTIIEEDLLGCTESAIPISVTVIINVYLSTTEGTTVGNTRLESETGSTTTRSGYEQCEVLPRLGGSIAGTTNPNPLAVLAKLKRLLHTLNAIQLRQNPHSEMVPPSHQLEPRKKTVPQEFQQAVNPFFARKVPLVPDCKGTTTEASLEGFQEVVEEIFSTASQCPVPFTVVPTSQGAVTTTCAGINENFRLVVPITMRPTAGPAVIPTVVLPMVIPAGIPTVLQTAAPTVVLTAPTVVLTAPTVVLTAPTVVLTAPTVSLVSTAPLMALEIAPTMIPGIFTSDSYVKQEVGYTKRFQHVKLVPLDALVPERSEEENVRVVLTALAVLDAIKGGLFGSTTSWSTASGTCGSTTSLLTSTALGTSTSTPATSLQLTASIPPSTSLQTITLFPPTSLGLPITSLLSTTPLPPATPLPSTTLLPPTTLLPSITLLPPSTSLSTATTLLSSPPTRTPTLQQLLDFLKTMVSSSTTTTPSSTTRLVVLQRILNALDDLENERQSRRIKEGMPCNLTGAWSSSAGGMLINITQDESGCLSVNLSPKSPPSKGFLVEPDWTFDVTRPLASSSMVLLVGTRAPGRTIAAFIGECRACGEVELINGNWLITRKSRSCYDRSCSKVLTDVWRKEMLSVLRDQRLKQLDISRIHGGRITEAATTQGNWDEGDESETVAGTTDSTTAEPASKVAQTHGFVYYLFHKRKATVLEDGTASVGTTRSGGTIVSTMSNGAEQGVRDGTGYEAPCT